MPKRLDELDGGDTPVDSDAMQQQREVDRFIIHLMELEEDPDYLFANDTITGIRTTVQLNHSVTVGQREAIAHIVDGVERRKENQEHRRGGSRRYEGFRGRRW